LIVDGLPIAWSGKSILQSEIDNLQSTI